MSSFQPISLLATSHPAIKIVRALTARLVLAFSVAFMADGAILDAAAVASSAFVHCN